MSYAIETQDLARRFGEIKALSSLNLRVKEGEVFGFLGPNGAGKTTTIRLLCGILEPSGGTAKVAGFDIVREPEAVKRKVGYMAQRFSLYGDLTVEENLHFFAGIYRLRNRERRRRVEEVLKQLGLLRFRKKLAEELSGGEKQRLALASAVVHRPPVLFLDEPTAGLDPAARQLLWEFLYQLAGEGTTIFVTTHYLEEAERCQSLGFLYEGKLLALGSPEQCKRGLAEDLLEVEAQPLLLAKELVRGMEEVRGVTLYGDRLRLLVPSAAEARPAVEEVLQAGGVEVLSLRISHPNLEDVFMALTGS